MLLTQILWMISCCHFNAWLLRFYFYFSSCFFSHKASQHSQLHHLELNLTVGSETKFFKLIWKLTMKVARIIKFTCFSLFLVLTFLTFDSFYLVLTSSIASKSVHDRTWLIFFATCQPFPFSCQNTIVIAHQGAIKQ